MNEPCPIEAAHQPHHWIDTDSNGYFCEGRAEQDGLDPAKVKAEHHNDGDGWCDSCQAATVWPCLPYRLAALVLDLQSQLRGMTTARDVWESNARWSRKKHKEAEALALDLQGKVARVEKVATAAVEQAERSLSRMFGGEPFPANVRAADVLAALADQPAPDPYQRSADV